MVLVRDRCAEERHDAVAGVLVHGALEAVHAVGEDVEEAVHDPVPRLGVDLLRQLHRAPHVGEEDGHLLALALEGVTRGEYLLGQVPRGVGVGIARGGVRQPARTPVAELLPGRVRRATGRAHGRLGERPRAFAAEAGAWGILVPAGPAGHLPALPAIRSTGPVKPDEDLFAIPVPCNAAGPWRSIPIAGKRALIPS